MTPQQRSLEYLEEQGWRVAPVEWYDHRTRRRHDLFGVFDLLAIRGSETMVVQVTTSSHVSARKKKMTDAEDVLRDVRAAGWEIWIHGWYYNAAKEWVCRQVNMS